MADGVGGWSGHPGADSALYSRTLMRYALKKAMESHSVSPSSSASPSSSPLAILETAYAETQQHRIIGSTTACIVTYDPHQQVINYANLGDSGLLIIRAPTSSTTPSQPRRPSVAFEKSEDRQHGFNCPLQLGHHSEDRPKDAAIAALEVRDGDLMVIATVSHSTTHTHRTRTSHLLAPPPHSSSTPHASPTPSHLCVRSAAGRFLR